MKSSHNTTVKFPILAINLSRRPDRLERLSAHMDEFGLDFVRIEATDGMNLPQVMSVPPFLPYGHVGAVESHRTAWKWIIENDVEGALILEDDAVLNKSFDWETLLPELNVQMSDFNIGLLQLGFINYGLRGAISVKVREKILRRREFLGKRETVTFATPTGQMKATIGSLRDGAHCNLVRREAAFELLNLNSPPFIPIDIMLETIGRRRSSRSAPLFACAKSSIAGQLSRRGRSTHDSDIDV